MTRPKSTRVEFKVLNRGSDVLIAKADKKLELNRSGDCSCLYYWWNGVTSGRSDKNTYVTDNSEVVITTEITEKLEEMRNLCYTPLIAFQMPSAHSTNFFALRTSRILIKNWQLWLQSNTPHVSLRWHTASLTLLWMLKEILCTIHMSDFIMKSEWQSNQ